MFKQGPSPIAQGVKALLKDREDRILKAQSLESALVNANAENERLTRVVHSLKKLLAGTDDRLQVWELLAADDVAWDASDVAKRLDMSRSVASGHLQSLTTSGALHHLGDGLFIIASDWSSDAT